MGRSEDPVGHGRKSSPVFSGMIPQTFQPVLAWPYANGRWCRLRKSRGEQPDWRVKTLVKY